ncbi:glycosyltransferase family 4 protein [Pseudaeromonas sp. ZJS20]|uniref:glycosyltransferase family 4 protein n=1 Tax=Pseudaeromonas aegiceratis TaxID=3153928 RepID=UPI00390C83A0
MVLKVFHVVRQYHPSIGGLEDVVFNIAQQQLKTGQQAPTVITLDRLFRGDDATLPHHEVRDGVPVIRLPYWGSSRYPICFKVLAAIRDADVVHVHGVDFFFDFLALTRFWHRKPLVACSHGIFFHTAYASGLKKVFFNTVTRLSCLAYRRIFATSANDGRLFAQVCNPAKIEVIENGVDIDKFRLPPRTEACKHIIYFGRWASNKGLLDTLSLFKQLLAKDDGWQLTIAGREYDLTAQQLAAEVKRLDIADKVQIVPNPEQDTLKSLLQQASYFICLSRHEGFGLAAIEAMSAGLVPILSAIPPFVRLVEETGQGELLAGFSEESIFKIMTLHERCSQSYTGFANAQVTAIQHYSWSQVARLYMGAYADMSCV